MGKYSIKDLEKLSGVKAHTIRIWEKRYNLLSPDRSDTNIRSYDDTQLKKILNVSSLLSAGHKISKVSNMPESQFIEAINKTNEVAIQNENTRVHIHHLIEFCLNFDLDGIDDEINKIISRWGMVYSFKEVFFPLLNRIGHLWATNEATPAHEHFLSNILRQVLFSATSTTHTKPNKKTYVLFLPEWEAHEISLLFCHYVLRKEGHESIYLGAQVPLQNLLQTIEKISPDHLVTSLVSPNYTEEFAKYLDTISDSLDLFACGHDNYSKLLDDKKNALWVVDCEKIANS